MLNMCEKNACKTIVLSHTRLTCVKLVLNIFSTYFERMLNITYVLHRYCTYEPSNAKKALKMKIFKNSRLFN